ncbi:MAG TPA: nuclear transport factor 2 family protein, partial [Candidatus Elarobacter sp.]|nr:nuclear transport factor 2 family protein [Candidatus Elarobacter sp.]
TIRFMRLIALLLLPILFAAQPRSAANAAKGLSSAPGGKPAQEDLSTSQRADLEKGMKHLLLTQVDAWNQGKLEAFMEGYWHSPDLTFFSGGTVTRGWEPTLLRYRQRYKSEGKEMGKLEFQDLTIDLLSPRSGIVRGKWQLTMSDGKQPHGLFTLILKRMPEGWRIVHDHTSGE